MTQNVMTSASSGVAAPPSLRTIKRKEANIMLRERAVELYDAACRKREQDIRDFEYQVGRCDRIDNNLLRDLDSLMARFAAIQARQARSTYGEPKVSKYVEQLGAMRGSLSAHLATTQALELFKPIEKAAYLGYRTGELGEKGRDVSVLAGYVVEDEANSAEPDEDDEAPCGHAYVEPYEEEPSRGMCINCDEEVSIRVPTVAAEAAA